MATKLIKVGAISSAILPTETVFFSIQQNIIRLFASAERTKARAQMKFSENDQIFQSI